ncbi:MAG TPA: cell division protein CrgA [Beutenbergiaceae bacterium]|nr:cell division protein CrgA [Beutenbergiaceae bacterium]
MPKSKPRKKPDHTPPPPVDDIKRSARWWAPTMVTLMVLGLAWVVVTYLTDSRYPIPGIGAWNLAGGFGVMMAGFLMTMRWR